MPRRREILAVGTLSGCYEVTSHKPGTDGYVRVRVNGRRLPAHRLVWEGEFGQVPEGLSVCHKCDNRRCVNPGHLFLGTTLDNIRDMYRKGRNYKGPRNAKLTVADVKEIRQSSDSYQELSKKFSVHPATIWSVKTFRSWIGDLGV